jgi:hypothetical protein
MAEKIEAAKREKFYTVSARLVFSGILVVIIAALILGTSAIINKGPIVPILGIGNKNAGGFNPTNASTSILPTSFATTTVQPILINVTCSPFISFNCINPVYNYSTGILTVAISQNSGYNWTSVTVRFVTAGTTYSHGVPELSWSPPEAVNVTGGLLTNTTKYVSIPITSGPVAVGTNITGSIVAKYQLNIGGEVSYANISSAVITVK